MKALIRTGVALFAAAGVACSAATTDTAEPTATRPTSGSSGRVGEPESSSAPPAWASPVPTKGPESNDANGKKVTVPDKFIYDIDRERYAAGYTLCKKHGLEAIAGYFATDIDPIEAAEGYALYFLAGRQASFEGCLEGLRAGRD